MKILVVSLQALALLVVFFAEISSASRTKRQIVFEDDNNNRLFNSDCQMPDRRPGRCIRLTNCRALSQTVTRSNLMRYFCGFEGDEPRVCCPLSRDEVPPTTTRRPTRRTNPPTRRPPTRTTVRFDEEPRNSGGGTQPGSNGRPSFLPQTCGVSLNTQTRVIGGTKADPGSWPWMAVVYVRRNNGALVPDCGGALVTNRHVVTAAHCVVSGRRSVTLDPSRIVVRLGAHNISVPNEPGAVDVDVEAVRRHEQFESRTYRNDIAVLKLSTPVTFSRTISPVCLPYDALRDVDLTNHSVIVIGYGTTAFNGNSSDVLMQAGFDVRSQETCRRAYEPEVQVTNVYMCAGTMDGSRDACQGDSGGPLLAVGNRNYYLVGIVSFGRQCGQPNYPGVYTRVTTFLDWLTRNLSD